MNNGNKTITNISAEMNVQNTNDGHNLVSDLDVDLLVKTTENCDLVANNPFHVNRSMEKDVANNTDAFKDNWSPLQDMVMASRMGTIEAAADAHDVGIKDDVIVEERENSDTTEQHGEYC